MDGCLPELSTSTWSQSRLLCYAPSILTTSALDGHQSHLKKKMLDTAHAAAALHRRSKVRRASPKRLIASHAPRWTCWLIEEQPETSGQSAREKKKLKCVCRLLFDSAAGVCHNHLCRLLSLWRRRPYSLAATLFIAVYTILALHLRYMTAEKTWITPFNILGPPTLVYDVRDMRRVWEWEIAAGHYPSSHRGGWMRIGSARFELSVVQSRFTWAPRYWKIRRVPSKVKILPALPVLAGQGHMCPQRSRSPMPRTPRGPSQAAQRIWTLSCIIAISLRGRLVTLYS